MKAAYALLAVALVVVAAVNASPVRRAGSGSGSGSSSGKAYAAPGKVCKAYTTNGCASGKTRCCTTQAKVDANPNDASGWCYAADCPSGWTGTKVNNPIQLCQKVNVTSGVPSAPSSSIDCTKCEAGCYSNNRCGAKSTCEFAAAAAGMLIIIIVVVCVVLVAAVVAACFCGLCACIWGGAVAS